jgi:hypothetical protein
MTERVKAGEILLEKQVNAGVRPIVEALDSLRILYGNDNVSVLTPRAESRIRTGYQAQILIKVELKLIYGDSDKKIVITLEFPRDYPSERVNGSVDSADDGIFWSQDRLIVLNDAICSIETDDALDYVKKIHKLVRETYENNTDRVGVPDELGGLSSSPATQQGGDHSITQHEDFPLDAIATCKLCRNVIIERNILVSAHSSAVIDQHGSMNTSSRCTSIFLVDPPSWLVPGEGMHGKLCCSKCSARVGQWSWIGGTCSCGLWLSPAFQINISKVDIKSI